MMCYRKNEKKQTESEELHLDIGYQRKGISTKGPTSGPTSVVFTLIPFKIYCGKFMKKYVEAIPGDDLWHTVP
jgi:hypothetical protein